MLTMPAGAFEYQLSAEQVKPDVYVVKGVAEDLSFKNGGNILNTGFIVTGEGVLVIDAGPSRLYGEQFIELIRATTDKPIKQVFITHHHPDHFFGLQAFDGVTRSALPETINDLRLLAEDYSDNMYRLIGNAMLGTEIVLPDTPVSPGTYQHGTRTVQLLALSGHTDSDLVIYDETSGVLFTGDLAFHQRAPTTPHADIARWKASLAQLNSLDVTVLVPGHGPLTTDRSPLTQTGDYIGWLGDKLAAAAAEGLSMAEAMYLPIDGRFESMAVVRNEFQRSVIHLYEALEQQLLPANTQ